MTQRVYKFLTHVDDAMDSLWVYPIFDDNGVVAGGFMVYNGDAVDGFIAGNENAVALAVSVGTGFWFTPILDSSGRISHAIVSECHPTVRSKRVTATEST